MDNNSSSEILNDNSSDSVATEESLARLQKALNQRESYNGNAEGVSDQSQGSLLVLICGGLVLIIIAIAYVSGWSLTGPDFRKIYSQFHSPSYAQVATDGSYLEIDTNKYDRDGYIDSDAMDMVKDVNRILGLPDSVLKRMEQTRALDGTQSFAKKGLTVRWTYHPDKGLEVIYSKE